MQIKKIAENIFEIEKEDKMNVPVRIFASEKLLDNIKQDKTFEQAKNMAMMPGVKNYVVVLPDAHQGYGACIGGVSAYDIKEGVVSPGQVGYDINCLTSDTKILTEFGASVKIEEFETARFAVCAISQLQSVSKQTQILCAQEPQARPGIYSGVLDNYKSELEIEQNGQKIKQIIFTENIPTLNITTKSIENKPINLLMSKESEEVYEITLSSGLKIKATADHPFLTKEGMKPLFALKNEAETAINLFEGIEDMSLMNKKEAIIAKLMGYMFGDGCFYKSKGRLYAAAYGTKEDLEKIQEDLTKIGSSSKLYSRKRKHEIVTRYGKKNFEATNHELHIHHQEFLHQLQKLGMPLGNKARQEIKVPEWIKKSNKIIKRLFLAGFFGAEMSSPKTLSKTCFHGPTIDQNKIASLKQDCRNFLIEIALLLEEFGIKNYKISEMEDHINKYNEKTSRLRLMIFSEENMLKLWRTIGFEYNKKRQSLANIASFYILLKKKENQRRVELAKKIKEYRKKGFNICEVKKLFINDINERFIERHYYENAKQRINLDFISFNEFCKLKLEELNSYGTIFDKVLSIKKLDGKFKVYDFNIKDNHNFIANGFVVSNCGVRLLTTNIPKSEFLKKRDALLNELYKNIPSGVGVGGELKFTDKEIDEVLEKGTHWALEKGYAIPEDIENTEDTGMIKGADAKKVSQKAKARGRNQLGTIGGGNHFIEIQEIETIYDEKLSSIFGIDKNNIAIMVHTGSRGLGHQTASDYIQKMERVYGFKHLPDRELVCAPIESDLGKDYLAAMNAAANFAFANRQLITYLLRKNIKKFFPNSEINLIYDIAHNIAKFEELTIGKKETLCIHRKGATRSFGPGRKELPKVYQETGQPILIPGSMGTFSYVLVGTKKAEEISLASTAHGAGRVLSRTYAKNNLSAEQVKKELESKNIKIKAGSMKGIVEEAPEAYKDVNEVVRVSHELGIGNLVVRLKPLAVIKG